MNDRKEEIQIEKYVDAESLLINWLTYNECGYPSVSGERGDSETINRKRKDQLILSNDPLLTF